MRVRMGGVRRNDTLLGGPGLRIGDASRSPDLSTVIELETNFKVLRDAGGAGGGEM